MMLPEMTSSARVARAFPRLARGAVAGLALGVRRPALARLRRPQPLRQPPDRIMHSQ